LPLEISGAPGGPGLDSPESGQEELMARFRRQSGT
jgi:hypothetical protein